jgi:hypothetical protein
VANIFFHGGFRRASRFRLPSNNPVYEFEHVFHGRKCGCGCGKEFYVVLGQYHTGYFASDSVVIKESEFDYWRRRILAGEAKPQPQLMSEWSQRAARGMDMLANLEYQCLISFHRSKDCVAL